MIVVTHEMVCSRGFPAVMHIDEGRILEEDSGGNFIIPVILVPGLLSKVINI